MANNNNNNIKTYRHEFGKEFMLQLSMFSKVHQYDDRHMYKSEWTKWVQQEDIAQAIDAEKRRLQENGYTGDIDDKMFKAGRYYFRKKTTTNKTSATSTPTSTVDAEPMNDNDEETTNDAEQQQTPAMIASPRQEQRQRRPYITMSKDTIRLMDDHIANMHNAAAATAATTATASQFKPSSCYDEFYQTKMSSSEMTREIEKIIEKYQKNAGTSIISPDELTNEIVDKIKKTYKNRYYKFVSSCN